MFRINFGNGQIQGNFKSKRQAIETLTRMRDQANSATSGFLGFAFIQRYDTGDWFKVV